ncbi:hypothetical protein HanHA300_Chr02g0068021 [Helianthus annuus]|nr:hypothetical protein HanHA300_Chr02g0068021 [Helianthus annuus]KAJ0619885.1 hypothetical protein HanHA89_Chr02g0076261 [Helianthus annuus]KAJ0787318.1 hypothetical protein HanOQP8_Chr02g0081161 [Helianthus annuus]
MKCHIELDQLFCGRILGFKATKLIRLKQHMEGFLIAMCSTGILEISFWP